MTSIEFPSFYSGDIIWTELQNRIRQSTKWRQEAWISRV